VLTHDESIFQRFGRRIGLRHGGMVSM